MSAYHLSDGQIKWNGRFVSILQTEANLCPSWLPVAPSGAERRVGGFLDIWGLSLAQLGPSILEVTGRTPGITHAPPLLGLVLNRQPSHGGAGPGAVESFQVVRLRERVAACGDSGGREQPGPRGAQFGPRCAQPARQAQPVFGEVAESEFQEAITLVETSFLWPGLVTWLGGDQRQAGPQVWASLHPDSCCHPMLLPRG